MTDNQEIQIRRLHDAEGTRELITQESQLDMDPKDLVTSVCRLGIYRSASFFEVIWSFPILVFLLHLYLIIKTCIPLVYLPFNHLLCLVPSGLLHEHKN